MTLRRYKEVLFSVLLFSLSIFLYYGAKHYAYFYSFGPFQLSETTASLLESFNQPLSITLYTQDEDVHRQVKMLMEHYQQVQPLIEFKWQKSTTQSAVLPQHALIVSYAEAKEIIDIDKTVINENALSNALFKLQRKPNQWVVFLQGHGEPSLFGSQTRDFNLLRQGLENQGLKIQALNLTQTPFIPDNASILVIASLQSALLPQEEYLIMDYLAKGKDLLWLIDPDSFNFETLSKHLGINFLPGTIADLHGTQLGTPHPAITIIDSYPTLPFEAPLTVSAFPFAQALTHSSSEYVAEPFLQTHEQTWTENDILAKSISFDPNKEFAGPLTLGFILKSKTNPDARLIVIGNSRFLSNGAIENYGNLALGLNLISWLNHDENLLNITQPIVTDNMVHLELFSALTIQYGFPAISLLLLLCSIIGFYWRKKTSDKMAMLARNSLSSLD